MTVTGQTSRGVVLYGFDPDLKLNLHRTGATPVHICEDGETGLLEALLRTEMVSVILTTESARTSVERVLESHRRLSGSDQAKPLIVVSEPERREPRLMHEVLFRHLNAADSRDVERYGLVGKSSAIRRLVSLIERLSPADAPVLITGPSGVGKELVARAVHRLSRRGDRPMYCRNCAALADGLHESELFGHVKGAFSGAVRDHAGLFARADGGTVFLDEVGELSLSVQAKLLRVLQEGTFTPVGSTEERRANVRLVSATNKNLEAMVDSGAFREDLYFRLNVFSIPVPPLVERREDIPLLASYFLKESCTRLGLPEKLLSAEALARLESHRWRGNVRELRNEIERLVVLTDGTIIGEQHLSPMIAETAAASRDLTLPEAVRRFEDRLIRDALDSFHGNKSQAARALGISRGQLLSKISRS